MINHTTYISLNDAFKFKEVFHFVPYFPTGKKGLYTGSSGLQLAYLSGIESDIVSDSTNFNAVDITSLTSPVVNDSKFKGVDILITSQWPKGVEKYGAPLVGIMTQLKWQPQTYHLTDNIRILYGVLF